MQRLALIAVIVLFAAAPAAAQTCTMDQLAGSYAFESRGQSALGMGPAPFMNHVIAAYAPTIVVGEANIHPDGSADGFYWGIMGTGNTGLERIPWEGQIVEFENCSGVMVYTVPVAGMGVNAQVTERFSVVNNGRELRSLATEFKVLTDPPQLSPVTWTSIMFRRNERQCGQSMIRGRWVMQCQSFWPVPSPGAPFTHIAAASFWRMTVDASGEMDGLWSIKAGPDHVETTLGGHLGVAADCTVEATVMSPVFGDQTGVARGMVYNEGKEMLVIPLGNTAPDGSVTLTPFASCRAIRVGR